MKPCNECPYKRTSERGFTSFREEARGTIEGTVGIVFAHKEGPVICHKTYKTSRSLCRGSLMFSANLETKDQCKEVFNTEEEMMIHHAYKEIDSEGKPRRKE